MKTVLMSGVTGWGSGASTRRRIDYFNVPMEIRRLLERHGWAVEHRPVAPGERLPQVGAVWINLGSAPDSLGAKHTLGTLWAMHEAIARELPLVMFFDDWRLDKMASGFRYFAKRGIAQITKQRGGA